MLRHGHILFSRKTGACPPLKEFLPRFRDAESIPHSSRADHRTSTDVGTLVYSKDVKANAAYGLLRLGMKEGSREYISSPKNGSRVESLNSDSLLPFPFHYLWSWFCSIRSRIPSPLTAVAPNFSQCRTSIFRGPSFHQRREA